LGRILRRAFKTVNADFRVFYKIASGFEKMVALAKNIKDS